MIAEPIISPDFTIEDIRMFLKVSFFSLRKMELEE